MSPSPSQWRFRSAFSRVRPFSFLLGLTIGAALIVAGYGGQAPTWARGEQGTIEERIAALEHLLAPVSREGRSWILTGVNVHIRSGSGRTDDDAGTGPCNPCTGLGNLVVGYDESDEPKGGDRKTDSFAADWVASSPTGGEAPDRKTGSHNVVIGPGHSYTSVGGLLAGEDNAVHGLHASAVGGQANTAFGHYTAVLGGRGNLAGDAERKELAFGRNATVSGGESNIASGAYASVSAGQHNVASGHWSSVSGGGSETPGLGNESKERWSSVSGGSANVASQGGAFVGGGTGNTADARAAAIIGGQGNVASGLYSMIAGGVRNITAGEYSIVSGGTGNKAQGSNTVIGGGTGCVEPESYVWRVGRSSANGKGCSDKLRN